LILFANKNSMPLTVLGGTLFQAPVGATLSTLCTGIGASLCYQLSRAFGRSLVSRYLSAQTKWLRGQIERNRCHLFQYIFAMRLTPVFPGWFLNITAPHIGITNPVFFYGTVAGIFPTTLIYSQAGAAIDSWTFGGETSGNVQIFTLGNIAFMLATLFVVVFGRRMKQRLIR
jgi:uncharacterized membrane protein YdjX (TVP38/TMEM64 family)